MQNQRKYCKHSVIQVVLNPSAGCFVTKAVGSTKGDILANVCVKCSDMKEDENTFEDTKNAIRTQRASNFVMPITRETEKWLKHCPFSRVANVGQDGVTINSQMTDLKVPPGTKWNFHKREESITIAKVQKPRQANLPINFARLAVRTMLEDEEEKKRNEDDPEDMLAFINDIPSGPLPELNIEDVERWLRSSQICCGEVTEGRTNKTNNVENEYVEMI